MKATWTDARCAADWRAPTLPDAFPHGDMPGDAVRIERTHIEKANVIFPALLCQIEDAFRRNSGTRAVASVYGGSGVGKSEIAAILSQYLRMCGVPAYTMSGDNYPLRIPKQNEAERLRTFRCAGTEALFRAEQGAKDYLEPLHALMANGADADPNAAKAYPWLSTYQSAGKRALGAYLGSPKEIDFLLVNRILRDYHAGAETILLKRMGRDETALWFDSVRFDAKGVLVLEWTHGNSRYLRGVDIPIYLHSTPEETLAHRRLRARDGAVDSPFTQIVLMLEQSQLAKRIDTARIIVNRAGELTTNCLDTEHCMR